MGKPLKAVWRWLFGLIARLAASPARAGPEGAALRAAAAAGASGA